MNEGIRFRPEQILLALLDRGVRFVVVGGLAASIRGFPGITQDLDVCYSRAGDNLERLAATLAAIDARLRGVDEDVPFLLDAKTLLAGDSFTFQTKFGDFDCVGTPVGTGGFEDLDATATDEGVGVVEVRVASLADLERMKRAAGRPKDIAALEWIRGAREELQRDRGTEPG